MLCRSELPRPSKARRPLLPLYVTICVVRRQALNVADSIMTRPRLGACGAVRTMTTLEFGWRQTRATRIFPSIKLVSIITVFQLSLEYEYVSLQKLKMPNSFFIVPVSYTYHTRVMSFFTAGSGGKSLLPSLPASSFSGENTQAPYAASNTAVNWTYDGLSDAYWQGQCGAVPPRLTVSTCGFTIYCLTSTCTCTCYYQGVCLKLTETI